MKLAGIREFRENVRSFVGEAEPVLVTRHGKISGLYLPLEDRQRVPDDLRFELARVLGEHLSRELEARNISEADVLADFAQHRRRRR